MSHLLCAMGCRRSNSGRGEPLAKKCQAKSKEKKKIPPHLPQRHARRTSLMLVAKILCTRCLHRRAGQGGGRTCTQGTVYLRSPPCHGSSPPPQKPSSMPRGRYSASTKSQASARKRLLCHEHHVSCGIVKLGCFRNLLSKQVL